MTEDFFPFHISPAEGGRDLGESWPITRDIFSTHQWGNVFYKLEDITNAQKVSEIRTDEIKNLVHLTK